MGMRVVDLRHKAQEVASEFLAEGHNLKDIASVAILGLQGIDRNELGRRIAEMNGVVTPGNAKAAVASAVSSTRRKVPRESRPKTSG